MALHSVVTLLQVAQHIEGGELSMEHWPSSPLDESKQICSLETRPLKAKRTRRRKSLPSNIITRCLKAQAYANGKVQFLLEPVSVITDFGTQGKFVKNFSS